MINAHVAIAIFKCCGLAAWDNLNDCVRAGVVWLLPVCPRPALGRGLGDSMGSSEGGRA